MNGAIAELLANIVTKLSKNRIIIKGNNQNNFRCFKNAHKSLKNSILMYFKMVVQCFL